MPREIGVVTEIKEGKIVLQLDGGDHCTHCAAKSMCAINENIRVLELPETISVNIGEKVEIEYTEKNRITIAIIIFLLPLLFLVFGYYLANLLFHSTTSSIIGSIIGLFTGISLPYFVNKWNEKKNLIQPKLVKKL